MTRACYLIGSLSGCVCRYLEPISAKPHAAPAASSLFAGVEEVQHALSALANAGAIGFREQRCRAMRQRGEQVLRLLRIEPQFRGRRVLHSG